MVVAELYFDSVPPPRHLQDFHQAETPRLSKSMTSDLVGGALVGGDSHVADVHHLQEALVVVLGVLLAVLLVLLLAVLLVVLLLLSSVDSAQKVDWSGRTDFSR